LFTFQYTGSGLSATMEESGIDVLCSSQPIKKAVLMINVDDVEEFKLWLRICVNINFLLSHNITEICGICEY